MTRDRVIIIVVIIIIVAVVGKVELAGFGRWLMVIERINGPKGQFSTTKNTRTENDKERKLDAKRRAFEQKQ